MKTYTTPGILPILLFMIATACNDDEQQGPEARRKLGEVMQFTGEAQGVDDGLLVECLCDLALELPGFSLDIDGTQQYTGTLGGEIIRAVSDEDGAEFSFAPFLFGAVEVMVKANDSIYVSWPGNLGTGIPYYDEIALFRGVVNTNERTVTGTWKCAPLLVDEGGYTDLHGVAEGTWRLEAFE